MNQECSWKRTQEAEIDLLELAGSLRTQWKKILACGLAAAVLAGGGSFFYSRSHPIQVSEAAWEEAAAQTTTQTAAGESKAPLTKEQQEQNETRAAQLRENIKRLETYLENSILMQVDPFHKDSRNLLFAIEDAQSHRVQKIMESYLGFLTYGAADAVKKSDASMKQIESSYLAELITSAQKAGSSYQSEEQAQTLSAVVLQVTVTGRDGQMAERIAADLQNVLQEYSKKVKKDCGSHKLTLLEHTAGERVDSTLLAQQREKQTLLATDRASLKTLLESGTAAGQKQTEPSGQKPEAEKEPQEAAAKGSISVVAVCFGFLGGALLYAAAYACWYMLQDVVHSAREFRRHYAIPFYGSLRQAQTSGRIRLLCGRQGITQLCMAVDTSFAEKEQAALEQWIRQLQEDRIQVQLAENLSANPKLWDSGLLTQTQAVLLVCGLKATSCHTVDDTMLFCLENDIPVLGAAVI